MRLSSVFVLLYVAPVVCCAQSRDNQGLAFNSVDKIGVPHEYKGYQLFLPAVNKDGWGIPRVEDVATITADIYDNGLNPGNVSNIVIPPNVHAELLQRFESFSVESLPDFQDEEIGRLRIVDKKTGFVTRISWYLSVTNTPLAFSLQGVRCFSKRQLTDSKTNQSLELDMFIRRVVEAQKKKSGQ